MRAVTLLPCAILTLAVCGCSEHPGAAASTAAPASQPQASSDTNMFGENKNDAAGNAQSARAAAFSSDQASQQAEAAPANPPAHR